MKIVMAVCGSRGDVQPAIVLAKALAARGHDVLMAAPPENAEWARAQGLAFAPLGGSVKDFVGRLTDAGLFSMRGASEMVRNVRVEVGRQLEELPDLCADADLLIAVSAAMGARTAALVHGIPYLYMTFFPQGGLASGHYPAVQLRRQTWPAWMNRLSWRVRFGMDNAILRSRINEAHARRGLAPIDDVWRYVTGDFVIVASDPELGAVPDDVAIPHVQTGHLALASAGDLDPSLSSFIEAGDAPIFLGFGSFPVKKAERVTATFVEGARAAGRRLVIYRGWGRIARDVENDRDCRVIDGAPFDRLFPRMAAVIHHGGAGTVATAARAGVPQIIVPQLFDHFYWGHQVQVRGLGPAPVWQQRLTVKRLARAIGDCVADGSYAARAQAAAAAIARRDSVGLAVAAVEDERRWTRSV